jgi:hypothetical protein
VNVNASQVSAKDVGKMKNSVKEYHTRAMNLVLKNFGMTVACLITANALLKVRNTAQEYVQWSATLLTYYAVSMTSMDANKTTIVIQ